MKDHKNATFKAGDGDNLSTDEKKTIRVVLTDRIDGSTRESIVAGLKAMVYTGFDSYLENEVMNGKQPLSAYFLFRHSFSLEPSRNSTPLIPF